MAIKFTSVKCPECGANLPIEEEREQIFCSYCGTKVIMTNENEHVYRHVDEALIRKTEAEHIIRLKKIEFAERKRVANEKTKKLKIIISIILGTIGIGLLLIGTGTSGLVGMVILTIVMYMWLFSDTEKEDDMELEDKVKVPAAINDYENKNYAAIETMFKNAGFTNVRCVPLSDLTLGVLKKSGTVDSISIDGQKISCGGKKFASNAVVIISYHSFSRK